MTEPLPHNRTAPTKFIQHDTAADNLTLRVMDIVAGTSVDGPGLRTTIYFAGCPHHCPECHNPQTWDFAAGTQMTVKQIVDEILDADFNVTFSGGDPLAQPLDALEHLARQVRDAGYTLWCYTGYTHSQLTQQPRFEKILSLINVLVDGPYIADLRDISLPFRGSSNQQIIRLNP